MICFKKVFSAILLLILIAVGGTAVAQDTSEFATERIAGDSQVGSQSPFPDHFELRRSGDAITGTVLNDAIFVGEPVGVAPNNWQKVRRIHLPNSGLRVSVTTRYYELLPGESEIPPDIQLRPVPNDWGSRQDVGVRLILAQPLR